MKSNQENSIKNIQVKIRAKVNLTEDPTKVENSIQNILGEKITSNINDDYLVVEDNLQVLSKIGHIVVKEEMDELLYNILERNKTSSSSKFFVNKQAAYHNQLHLIDDEMSPLGDIEVEIFSDDMVEVMEYITS